MLKIIVECLEIAVMFEFPQGQGTDRGDWVKENLAVSLMRLLMLYE